MSFKTSAYTVGSLIYESRKSLIYSATRNVDGESVILKVLNETHPSPKKIAWFKREYQLSRMLDADGVIKAYDLVAELRRVFIVLEDFGGRSFENILKERRLTVKEFLTFGPQIARALEYIHEHGIIHKDINPSNILLNEKTGAIKIIDFGIASKLDAETASLKNVSSMEGTLAYVAPEQTGRMNRAIDYRADFYSLGVTFYELLTGKRPFNETEPLALIHAHIARSPLAPHEVDPAIPSLLSAITLKLMSKNEEDRYQSAHGLLADLETCQNEWIAKGQITPFPLAQADVANRLTIPQKLYGRQQEINTLLEGFTRVASGSNELLLVSGYAGIGKSALVREVYKPLTKEAGYFSTGKFDQLRRDIPYASLAHAFRGLVRQILSGSADELAVWRDNLKSTLGENGQILIEVIPEIELIIGKQPAAPVLPAMESRNRFNYVFHNFVRLFTAEGKPLVLFLDDLQWADSASLDLTVSLLTSPEITHFFLLGAYREREVDDAHPLTRTLAALNEAGTVVNEIQLQPLTAIDISAFVADMTLKSIVDAKPLAQLIGRKTNGNPFFMIEFSRSLYANKLLRFTAEDGWLGDVEAIEKRDLTDNVIVLLTDKIRGLLPAAQDVLRLAACIGNEFSLQVLATVYEKSPQKTAVALQDAIVNEVIIPIDEAYRIADMDIDGLDADIDVRYRFAHDRVQQAVYTLIPEDSRQITHWRVGQLLREEMETGEKELSLFDIVYQLNRGATQAVTIDTKKQLADLNLHAGRQAKASAAYQPAYLYLNTGLDVLLKDREDTSVWSDTYDLAITLHFEAAEAAYLSNEYETMDQLIATIHKRANSNIVRARAYDVKLQSQSARARHTEAVETALTGLALLGITFPEAPDFNTVFQVLGEIGAALAGKSMSDLANAPLMDDEQTIEAMRILNSVNGSVFITNPVMYLLMVLKQVQLLSTEGNLPDASFVYTSYGLILAGIVGDIDTGFAFGELGMALLDKLDARAFKTKTYFIFYNQVRHWKLHIRENAPLIEAFYAGLETGDFIFGGYAATNHCAQIYHLGNPLSDVAANLQTYNTALTNAKQLTALNYGLTYQQAIHNLMDTTVTKPQELIGTIVDETILLPSLEQFGDRTGIFFLYINKQILAYLFGDYEEALRISNLLMSFLDAVTGSVYIPVAVFYDALIRLANIPGMNEEERVAQLEIVAGDQEKMKQWASFAPMNYQHKYILVEAERARVDGNELEARDLYDEAIQLALENEFLSEEALAYELAGRFYVFLNKQHLARYHLRDAHYAYLRWGAMNKISRLEAEYPVLLARSTTGNWETVQTLSTTGTVQSTTTIQEGVGVLDLASIIQASQIISGEIRLEKLLDQLMRVVIENGGARHGYLLLQQDGTWNIEAEIQIGDEEINLLQSIPITTAKNGKARLPLSIVNFVAHTQEAIILNNATKEGEFTQEPYIVMRQPHSVLCAPLVNQGNLNGILYLENDLAAGAFTNERVAILRFLTSQAAISIENARLYENISQLNRAYERFVPRQFLSFLEKKSIIDVRLGDQVRKEMTILFSDIRDFTTISEKMTPEHNFRFVNNYLSRMNPIIVKHRGFIDKYIGDSIMALYPTNADDALLGSLEMLRALNKYNEEQHAENISPLRIGIGLHTGLLMMGMVGGHNRMDGTVISDAVNLASRVEGLTKRYGTPLLITHATYTRLENPAVYNIRQIDRVRVKGKTEAVSIFEVFTIDDAESRILKTKTADAFQEGLSLFWDQEFDDATKIFSSIAEQNPADTVAKLHYDSCVYYAKHGAPSRLG